MKLIGELPYKPRSFEELLARLADYFRPTRYRLLKTARRSGYYTDGESVTRLGAGETLRVKRDGDLLLVSSPDYAGCEPLDLRAVLPRRVGDVVKTAEYAGRGQEYALVLLRGDSTEQLVEAAAFATMLKRHSGATWYFARGAGAWKKPVVLLEPGGFGAGELLGALAPVCVKGVVSFSPGGAASHSLSPSELRYDLV